MVANRKVTGKAASMPAGIGLGIALSFVLTMTGCAVVAALIDKEMMAAENVGYGAMVILLVASLTGAIAASGLIKHKRLAVCMASGVGYFLTLLAVNLLCFGGQFAGVGVTALVVLAGSAAAALVGIKGEGGRQNRRRKYRTG